MNLSDCPNIDCWIKNSSIFLFPQRLVCKQKFELLNQFTIKIRILLLRFWLQEGYPPPLADKICADKLVAIWGIFLRPPPFPGQTRKVWFIHAFDFGIDLKYLKDRSWWFCLVFARFHKSQSGFSFVTWRRRLNEFYQDPIFPSFLFSIVTPWISFFKIK